MRTAALQIRDRREAEARASFMVLHEGRIYFEGSASRTAGVARSLPEGVSLHDLAALVNRNSGHQICGPTCEGTTVRRSRTDGATVRSDGSEGLARLVGRAGPVGLISNRGHRFSHLRTGPSHCGPFAPSPRTTGFPSEQRAILPLIRHCNWNWLKTKVTIKGGVIVVDKR